MMRKRVAGPLASLGLLPLLLLHAASAQSTHPASRPDSAAVLADSVTISGGSVSGTTDSIAVSADSVRVAPATAGPATGAAEAGGVSTAPSGPSEPWLLEGESLEGTNAGGTDVVQPRITHGVLKISAVTGHLSPDRDLLTLRDSVVIADTARTIHADNGVYRRAARILDLTGNVRGKGTEGTFHSHNLTWDRRIGRMVLRGEPVLEQPDRIIQSVRIEYETEARRGVAEGDVRILLLPDSVRASGERSDYDERTGRSVLTGVPRLTVPGSEGEPVMTVLADTLILRESDGSGEAIGSVRITRGDLRTFSRKAEFRLAQNRILLTGEPVAWDLDGDIRADTMAVRVRQRKADQLQAWGSVQVRYEPRGKAGEHNLVLGDTLTAGLSGGSLTGMEVFGRAQSLYLPAFHDVLSGSGRNLSHARSIRVVLREGQAQRVDLIGGAAGSYHYPSDASHRLLADPAAADTLVPAWAREPVPAETTRTEPPVLPDYLRPFVKERKLAFPDTAGSFDRLFDEHVDYDGDTIRFFVPEDRIRLQGNGTLHYRESALKSSRIDYDAGRRLVVALGKPELSDAQSTVTGVKMTYRTDEQEGIVYRGRTEFEGGYYQGRQVKKLPDNALLVKSGDYTTCDRESLPDYHFHSSRMKLIRNDKGVARPVILYVRRIPLLALPYYVFPLQKGRHSGIMMPDLELGLNRNAGRFVRNFGYYWAMSDYMDTRAWIDYYDRGPRIYLNGAYNYKVRYLLDGTANGSWLNERNAAGGRSKGWSLQGSHSQQLGNNATASLRANFTSSQTYRGDQNFGAGVDERLNRILTSSAEVRKGWSRTSLSTSLSRTEYLDQTTGSGVKVSVTGPSVDFNVNSGAIGRAPDASGRGGRLAPLSSVYYGTSFRYRTVYTRRFDGTISAAQAVQQNVSLTDTRSLGRFLRIGPSAAANWAFFGRDALGNRYRGGAAWSFNVSAGNTLYGNFLFPVGPLVGLRHIIEPSVSWGYSPELRRLTYRDPADSTGQRRLARFPNVSGIGLAGSKRSALSLSLNQRFHARWKFGSRVIKQENILTLSTSTSYDFLAKPITGQARVRRFSTISNSLRFKPLSTLEASASVSHDPYTRAPLSFSVRTTATITGALLAGRPDTTGAAALRYGGFGDAGTAGGNTPSNPRGTTGGTAGGISGGSSGGPWNASISHSYSTSQGSSRASNNLNLSLSFHPSKKWRCNASVYIDARTREVVSHSFSLYRDLHCWDLSFDHITSGNQAQYSFKISIRQMPDVQYLRQSR